MSSLQLHDDIFPKGYLWAVRHSWAGYTEFTALQPWYFLEETKRFIATDKWPNSSFSGKLIAFARRQDNDEIACFVVESNKVVQIIVINGWTSMGYDVLQTYSSFWEWMKIVIDDIAEWVEDM